MSKVLDYITAQLKIRQEKGLKKYGHTIDDCDPPTGSFLMEVNEELLDALQYQTRYCMLLEEHRKIVDAENERLKEELEEYYTIRKELKHGT